MATTPIVTWNVRGVHDPLKRTMIRSGLKKFLPAIVGLQETHLTKDTVGCLGFSWVGKAYHSTHTSYSRGVSVLIHRSLAYQEMDAVVDALGRYVFLYCKLFTVTMILAFVYIPPPFSREVLQLLLSYLGDKPDIPVMIMGDFNACIDPREDRHPPARMPQGNRGTALSRWMGEVGWLDVWRARFPTT